MKLESNKPTTASAGAKDFKVEKDTKADGSGKGGSGSPARAQGDRFDAPSGTGASVPVPERDLKRGDQGEDVKNLQKHLVRTGHLTQAEMDSGPGVFGPKT